MDPNEAHRRPGQRPPPPPWAYSYPNPHAQPQPVPVQTYPVFAPGTQGSYPTTAMQPPPNGIAQVQQTHQRPPQPPAPAGASSSTAVKRTIDDVNRHEAATPASSLHRSAGGSASAPRPTRHGGTPQEPARASSGAQAGSSSQASGSASAPKRPKLGRPPRAPASSSPASSTPRAPAVPIPAPTRTPSTAQVPQEGEIPGLNHVRASANAQSALPPFTIFFKPPLSVWANFQAHRNALQNTPHEERCLLIQVGYSGTSSSGLFTVSSIPGRVPNGPLALPTIAVHCYWSRSTSCYIAQNDLHRILRLFAYPVVPKLQSPNVEPLRSLVSQPSSAARTNHPSLPSDLQHLDLVPWNSIQEYLTSVVACWTAQLWSSLAQVNRAPEASRSSTDSLERWRKALSDIATTPSIESLADSSTWSQQELKRRRRLIHIQGLVSEPTKPHITRLALSIVTPLEAASKPVMNIMTLAMLPDDGLEVSAFSSDIFHALCLALQSPEAAVPASYESRYRGVMNRFMGRQLRSGDPGVELIWGRKPDAEPCVVVKASEVTGVLRDVSVLSRTINATPAPTARPSQSAGSAVNASPTAISRANADATGSPRAVGANAPAVLTHTAATSGPPSAATPSTVLPTPTPQRQDSATTPHTTSTSRLPSETPRSSAPSAPTPATPTTSAPIESSVPSTSTSTAPTISPSFVAAAVASSELEMLKNQMEDTVISDLTLSTKVQDLIADLYDCAERSQTRAALSELDLDMVMSQLGSDAGAPSSAARAPVVHADQGVATEMPPEIVRESVEVQTEDSLLSDHPAVAALRLQLARCQTALGREQAQVDRVLASFRSMVARNEIQRLASDLRIEELSRQLEVSRSEAESLAARIPPVQEYASVGISACVVEDTPAPLPDLPPAPTTSDDLSTPSTPSFNFAPHVLPNPFPDWNAAFTSWLTEQYSSNQQLPPITSLDELPQLLPSSSSVARRFSVPAFRESVRKLEQAADRSLRREAKKRRRESTTSSEAPAE